MQQISADICLYIRNYFNLATLSTKTDFEKDCFRYIIRAFAIQLVWLPLGN